MVEKRSSDPDSTGSIPVFLKPISDSFNPHVHNWDLIENTQLNWGSRKYVQPTTGLARALVGSWIGDHMVLLTRVWITMLLGGEWTVSSPGLVTKLMPV